MSRLYNSLIASKAPAIGSTAHLLFIPTAEYNIRVRETGVFPMRLLQQNPKWTNLRPRVDISPTPPKHTE
jgi:hypothetical protein